MVEIVMQALPNITSARRHMWKDRLLPNLGYYKILSLFQAFTPEGEIPKGEEIDRFQEKLLL